MMAVFKNLRMARGSFAAGVIHMLPMTLAAAPFGLIVGAMGRQVGLETWELLFMSAAVFAGAAQFIALEMWTAPLPALAIIGTVLMVNLRHILMGAAIAPHIKGLSGWAKFPYLYAMADETWAMSLRSAIAEGHITSAYLMGLTVPFYINWLFWSYLGTQIGDLIRDPAVFGFDFVFTAVFITLVFGFWRHNRQLAPIVASALVALLVRELVPGSWYIFIGSLAGVLAALVTFKPGAAPSIEGEDVL